MLGMINQHIDNCLNEPKLALTESMTSTEPIKAGEISGKLTLYFTSKTAPEINSSTVSCPVCKKDLSLDDNGSLNQHIDLCLNRPILTNQEKKSQKRPVSYLETTSNETGHANIRSKRRDNNLLNWIQPL